LKVNLNCLNTRLQEILCPLPPSKKKKEEERKKENCLQTIEKHASEVYQELDISIFSEPVRERSTFCQPLSY
jgi:hypothetical protein